MQRVMTTVGFGQTLKSGGGVYREFVVARNSQQISQALQEPLQKQCCYGSLFDKFKVGKQL